MAAAHASVRTMIPGRPGGEIAAPERGSGVAGRIGLREPLVERQVAQDGHADATEEIEGRDHDEVRHRRRRPARQARDCEQHADGRCAEEDREEQRVQHGEVDRLHRRDRVSRRQPAECAHDEAGEGEESAGHQAAAEFREQGERDDQARRHHRPVPVAAASARVSRASRWSPCSASATCWMTAARGWYSRSIRIGKWSEPKAGRRCSRWSRKSGL